MAVSSMQSVAFAMPGGETSSLASGKPIDLAHLERQTSGDRDLEREILSMFAHQAAAAAERIGDADLASVKRLAHTLKGSARGVGAFGIAAIAEQIETDPANARLIGALIGEIGTVRDFISAVNR